MSENTASKPEENPQPDFDIKKWLYSFKAKDVAGLEKTFFILKPSRTLRQLGEVEYAKQLANFVKAGLLPKAAWNTILENLGGTVSNTDAESYTGAKRKFFECSIELNRLAQLPELNETQKIEKARWESEFEDAKKDIQTFELEQIYIFENTAEAKARNATIQWWLAQTAYKSETETFFEGNTLDERLDWYDGLDPDKEDEAFKIKIGQRFNYLITLWFLNRISSWIDFKDTDTASRPVDVSTEVATAVTTAVTEAPAPPEVS